MVQNLRKYAILWVPPVAILAAFLLQKPLTAAANFIGEHIFFCFFYETTGLYCLGCGATRSVRAMLRGEFLLALHNNPVPYGLILSAILLYAERVAAVFGKTLRLFPRKAWFWYTVLGLLIVWDVARNFVPAMAPIG